MLLETLKSTYTYTLMVQWIRSGESSKHQQHLPGLDQITGKDAVTSPLQTLINSSSDNTLSKVAHMPTQLIQRNAVCSYR